MLGFFRTPRNGLSVELRPRCPKCQKEFMLNLKTYLPGRSHACYACGTVAAFDGALAEKLQKQIKDLEMTIQEVLESLDREK
jgi:hypothetical protein